MSTSTNIFYGAVINPVSLTEYAVLPRCLLAVNAAGNIDWLVDDVGPSDLQETLALKGYVDINVVNLKDGEFIIPGFIDTHTHAPQVPNMGGGGQYQLLDWLKRVTFPMEKRFSDVNFARNTYESVVRRFIDGGTTTCCYYGSLHLESTKVLADIVHSYGQRAFVGKCNMNRESPPDYIEPTVEGSIKDTEELIAHIRSLPQHPSTPNQEPRVQPILTPRFAISCTPDLLQGIGEVSQKDPTLRIQTHISENPSEVEYTKELFKEYGCQHYAGVYHMFNLLRRNTILAHAVHLTEPEMVLIKETKSGISHCPTSNFNLSSGVAPVGIFLDKGINVGLGTDVSGGFSYSILNAIRDASIASKVCSFTSPAPSSSSTTTTFANKPLPIPTLLYLATMGGAAVCDLDTQIGSFAPGKSFDALVVNTRNETGNPGLWGDLGDVGSTVEEKKARLENCLERFLFCGDDRNISKVYVQGKVIGGRTFSQ